jgi:uncharacterized membrane protein
MVRSLVLFAHIVGVLALFAGLTVEWLCLNSVRRSTTRAEALPWVRLNTALRRVYGVGFALIVLSGFYLGGRMGVLGQSWMLGSYGALLLMGILGGPVVRRRVRVLGQAAEDSSDRALAALRAAASASLLDISLRARVALGLAVVYLMVGKPAVVESQLVIGLALVLAIVTSLRKRQPESTFVEGYR